MSAALNAAWWDDAAAATPFATGGNICNAVTATANVQIIATYSATNGCWNLK